MKTLPPEIKRGSDTRKHWTWINHILEAVRELQGKVRQLFELAAARERRELDNERMPFKVELKQLLHHVALADRAAIADTWWRTFQVRHGLTNFKATAGCADTDGTGSVPTYVTVPADTAVFYIWCDFTDASAPTIEHTTIAGAVVTHWDSFPELPDGIRPIAKITTTDEAPATVRQLQHGDIWPSGSGGGGLPTWLP